MQTTEKYDLIAIGSGPGGEKAAVQAAKLGKRVLVVENGGEPGGSCIHRGTIPSKTLRESVRYMSLIKKKAIYGMNVQMARELTVNNLMHRKRGAIQSLVDRLERTFDRNDVDYLHGEASFVDPHRVQVRVPDTGSKGKVYESQTFIIARVLTRHGSFDICIDSSES